MGFRVWFIFPIILLCFDIRDITSRAGGGVGGGGQSQPLVCHMFMRVCFVYLLPIFHCVTVPDIRDTTPRPGAVSASGRILTTPSSARMNSSRMGSPTRNTSPRRKPESARLPTTRKLGAVAESRPVSHQAVNQSKEGVAATPNAPPTSPEPRPKEKAPRRTKSYRTDMVSNNG